MDRIASPFLDVQWVAQCAHRLRRQWPHADLASLDEAAAELWRIDWMREMGGEDAAELWLRPISRRPGAIDDRASGVTQAASTCDAMTR